jgi:hypothetical protein
VFWGGNSDGTVAGWRGVHNELVYTAKPNPGPMYWVRGQGTIWELCRVTIPYPGTPFTIYPSGRFNPLISPGVSLELRINRSSPTGTAINFQHAHTLAIPDPPGDHPLAVNVAPITDGPFTGPLDVVLNVFIREARTSSAGFGYAGDDQGQHLLSVIVKPATIDPAKVWP